MVRGSLRDVDLKCVGNIDIDFAYFKLYYRIT
jgi:hypothetical protein